MALQVLRLTVADAEAAEAVELTTEDEALEDEATEASVVAAGELEDAAA